jgi:hypothetical protein
MKKILSLAALLCLFTTVAFAQFNPVTYMPPVHMMSVSPNKSPLQIQVSPNGKSFIEARDEIRKLKKEGKLPNGGITVNIKEGIYYLKQSFSLTDEDSGTPKCPIIYKGASNGATQLIGGIHLTSQDFKKVKDNKTLARADKSSRDKLLELDLTHWNVQHAKAFPNQFSDGGGIFELFVGGKRMPLSRWPDNDGYTTMKEVIENGDKNKPGTFVYRDDRSNRWDVSKGVWLKGFWRVGWENPAMKVASIDTLTHQITFATGLNAGIGSKYKRPKGSGEEKWCAINLLEEITQPGEWCIDFTTHKLYIYPPADFDKADIVLSQQETPLIQMDHTTNVAFINLSFEYSLGDGVSVQNGKNDLIAGCCFKNLAGRGIVLNGEQCGIQSNDMSELGQGCIIISGGDRNSLTPSGNYIINNHLHHYGVLKSQYSAAIDLYHDSKDAPAVGIYIAHNAIHHGPRDGILLGGDLNVFEYNQVYRCAYNTADTGAFYSWLDWTNRGLIIRYNYIYDTVGGYNPDDGSSGGFIYGNVFKGDRTGVWIASGPDNVVKDNIFMKESGPVYGVDDRGEARGYATNKRLISKVESIHPDAEPWSKWFPEMPTLLQEHPELPQRNVFENNIVWIQKGEATVLHMKDKNKNNPQLVHIQNNYVTASNPGFINSDKGNYNLRPSSAALKMIPNFPKIDVSRTGLYIDSYRKVLPSADELGTTPETDPWNSMKKSTYFGT